MIFNIAIISIIKFTISQPEVRVLDALLSLKKLNLLSTSDDDIAVVKIGWLRRKMMTMV